MDWDNTALVIVDAQVDLLDPAGALWDLVGDQVSRFGIVDKLISLRNEAEAAGVPVFYSWLSISDEDYAALRPKNGLQELMAARKVVAEALPEVELYGFTPNAGLPRGFRPATDQSRG